jgi:hypothetical protein
MEMNEVGWKFWHPISPSAGDLIKLEPSEYKNFVRPLNYALKIDTTKIHYIPGNITLCVVIYGVWSNTSPFLTLYSTDNLNKQPELFQAF